MHELKKSDLIEIKRCLSYMIKGGTTPYSCETLDVKKKVQQMIDEYDIKVIKVWHREKCGCVQ